eukprot:PDM60589.1 hypothetical protein PRIPAC_53567 [Pristionchus pacificus]
MRIITRLIELFDYGWSMRRIRIDILRRGIRYVFRSVLVESKEAVNGELLWRGERLMLLMKKRTKELEEGSCNKDKELYLDKPNNGTKMFRMRNTSRRLFILHRQLSRRIVFRAKL